MGLVLFAIAFPLAIPIALVITEAAAAAGTQ